MGDLLANIGPTLAANHQPTSPQAGHRGHKSPHEPEDRPKSGKHKTNSRLEGLRVLDSLYIIQVYRRIYFARDSRFDQFVTKSWLSFLDILNRFWLPLHALHQTFDIEKRMVVVDVDDSHKYGDDIMTNSLQQSLVVVLDETCREQHFTKQSPQLNGIPREIDKSNGILSKADIDLLLTIFDRGSSIFHILLLRLQSLQPHLQLIVFLYWLQNYLRQCLRQLFFLFQYLLRHCPLRVLLLLSIPAHPMPRLDHHDHQLLLRSILNRILRISHFHLVRDFLEFFNAAHTVLRILSL